MSSTAIIQPPNARRVRPNMPSYGVMPDATEGMLTWDWVAAQMKAARNYWVCTVNANGSPHATPVWGVWHAGDFYFGAGETSVKVRNIRRDPRVLIHLDSGDEVVIFEGQLLRVELNASLDELLTAEYVRKYQLDPEMAESDSAFFRLQPRKVMGWLESDYPATATYWLFDV